MRTRANPVFGKLRLITYVDGPCGKIVLTRVISTRYIDASFCPIALRQVNATQTNVMLAVN